MQINSHINVFDFDETLFRVPGYCCKEAAGRTPYEWFDDPASLDESLNTKWIENTMTVAQDATQTNFLITHRVDACRKAVMSLLEKAGARFNDVFFMGRTGHKAEIVIKLIRENPQIQRVSIYEDSLWQVIEYFAFLAEEKLDERVEFEFFFVDKSKIITIDWSAAKLINETANVNRLTIQK